MNSHCFFIGTTLADNPVPQHFVALAKELAKRGHKTLIIAPHRRVDLEDHTANPAVYTWPSERPTKLSDSRFLRELFRQCSPSCLIANFAAVNLMMTQGWLCRVPMRVAWYHTISSQLKMDNPKKGLKEALFQWRKRFVYHTATHLAANSMASAQDVHQVFGVPPSKCRVFHNSLADPEETFSLSPELPITGRIICVGRFDHSKGQDVLIKALSTLQKKVPSAHIEFIGEGPSQNFCKQLACQLGILEKCTFSGRVTHNEVLKRMSTSVVTVVPSRNEAFGLVNIESMAVGTPVVASEVGGIPEIVRNGLDGMLVPPENADALASALKTLLTDIHLRREMRVNARQQFLSKFELSHAVREQANWFERILDGVI